ncbi:MAG: hypothetical protein V4721_13855 [Bacteroidota bacterium]
MLSEFYQGNEHVEEVKQKTLNLRVSCTNQLAEKLNAALHFVIKKIGFAPLDKITFTNESKQFTLFDADGSKLSIDIQIIGHNSYTENIIFHTNDCLRDYHKYTMLGVEFINRPEYNTSGLQVNFIDDNDNCYTLLEERFYTES